MTAHSQIFDKNGGGGNVSTPQRKLPPGGTVYTSGAIFDEVPSDPTFCNLLVESLMSSCRARVRRGISGSREKSVAPKQGHNKPGAKLLMLKQDVQDNKALAGAG
jgi:hypothetical protein